METICPNCGQDAIILTAGNGRCKFCEAEFTITKITQKITQKNKVPTYDAIALFSSGLHLGGHIVCVVAIILVLLMFYKLPQAQSYSEAIKCFFDIGGHIVHCFCASFVLYLSSEFLQMIRDIAINSFKDFPKKAERIVD